MLFLMYLIGAGAIGIYTIINEEEVWTFKDFSREVLLLILWPLVVFVYCLGYLVGHLKELEGRFRK